MKLKTSFLAAPPFDPARAPGLPLTSIEQFEALDPATFGLSNMKVHFAKRRPMPALPSTLQPASRKP